MNNTPISKDKGQVETEVARLTREHAVLLQELELTPRPGHPPLRRHRREILAEFRAVKLMLQRWFVWLHQAAAYEQRHAAPPRRIWLSAEARACIRDAGLEDIWYLNQRSGKAA